MSFAAVLLICLGGLALLLIFLFELIQILSEGGLKLLIWPRLNHGYEVAPVSGWRWRPGRSCCSASARMAFASLPSDTIWSARPAIYAPWLLATIVPVLMIHLIDYRRSVLAAALPWC